MDPDNATDCYNRGMIASLPDSDPWKFLFRCSLRNVLRKKFEACHDEASLRPAIQAAEDVVAAASEGDAVEYKPSALVELGDLVMELCELHLNQRKDELDYAIDCLEGAVSCLTDRRQQGRCLNNLSGRLFYRYNLTGELEDIRRSLDRAEQALGLNPASGAKPDPHRARLLYNLSNKQAVVLKTVWSGEARGREAEDLVRRALETSKDAFELLPPDDARRRRYGTRYASSQLDMFHIKGDMDALHRAIEFCNGLSQMVGGEGVEGDSEYWNTLAGLLRQRYLATEVRKDIFDGIGAARKALDALGQSHPLRATFLVNLASMLYLRSRVEGMRPGSGQEAQRRLDLDEAVVLAEEAVYRTPVQSPGKGVHLSALVGMLTERTLFVPPEEQKRDLDRALSLAEQAVALTPEGDWFRLQTRSNLARVRFLKAASEPGPSGQQCLAAAVSEQQAAADGTPDEDPNKPLRFANLGHMLKARYDASHADSDLEAAINAFERCSRCTSTATPSLQVTSALAAAELLVGQGRDFLRADRLLRGAVARLRHVSPRSLRQADQQHIVRRFAGLATLAAATALEVGAEASDALALLEEGRGIILGLLFEARSDVGTLRAHPEHVALAEEFERLRDALDRPSPGMGADDIIAGDNEDAAAAASSWAMAPGGSFVDLTRRSRLAADLDVLVEKIQRLEGFEDFMRTPRVAELQRAAAAGPIVVVNVSDFRCDALIVHHDRNVQMRPLPNISRAEAKTWSDKLKTRSITEPQMFELLSWLWDGLASPVLERLQSAGGHEIVPTSGEESQPGPRPRETGISQGPGQQMHRAEEKAVQRHAAAPSGTEESVKPPRVWWIPTGPLCSLPIHAAGRYGPRAPASENVLEQTVSSYSPSIKALLFAQRNRTRSAYHRPGEGYAAATGTEATPAASPLKALVVAMETTEDQNTLPAAKTEAETVRRVLLSGNSKQPAATADKTVILDVPELLTQPNKAIMIAQLRDAGLLHFAGHGFSNPFSPLRSALLLRDWKKAPLTVTDLIDEFRRHDRPRLLAYLSACSSGSSRATGLADEGLHLMIACQLVGFQHVVGSLWEVSDSHCVEVADRFYAALVADGGLLASGEAVARRLRGAVRAMRDQERVGAGVVMPRAGYNVSAARAHRELELWYRGDPRLWAAYIHMGL